MLRTLQLTVVLLGILFFLTLAGLAYYSSSPTQHPDHQYSDYKPDDKNESEDPRSIGGFIHFLFPDAISIFTFCLVVATIALGVIAYVQIDFLRRAETISAQTAKAAQDSAEAATQTLVTSNRPWIKADIRVGGPVSYNVNGINFPILYILENIGHSPATQVSVNSVVIAPALGIDRTFDERGELVKIIEREKERADLNWGITLFPGDTIPQTVTVTIGNDELKRITGKSSFIMPYILGSISYRMALDNKVHQTAFIFQVSRSGRPRPESAAKNRSPSAIFPDEGDIPADDVRLMRSPLEGGYAD